MVGSEVCQITKPRALAAALYPVEFLPAVLARVLAHLITTEHELAQVILGCPPDAHVVGVDAHEDDPLVILLTDLLPGPIVERLIPGRADLDLSLNAVDDPIMLRRSGTIDTMPEGGHHLLNQSLALSAFGLGGGNVAEGLKLAAFPDGLLAALPLLVDGEGFDQSGVGHGPLWVDRWKYCSRSGEGVGMDPFAHAAVAIDQQAQHITTAAVMSGHAARVPLHNGATGQG